MSVAAVLLAAGEGRRFGSAKQLARLGERSLVRRAAEVALASRCAPVYVVVGAQAEAVQRELAGLALSCVRNEEWAEGMGASIRSGVLAAAAAEPRCEGVALLLADQARVESRHLDELVRRFEEGEGDVVASEYGGVVGPPVVFARRFFPALEALRGDRGARALLEARPEGLVRVPLPEGAEDVDRPADLARLEGS